MSPLFVWIWPVRITRSVILANRCLSVRRARVPRVLPPAAKLSAFLTGLRYRTGKGTEARRHGDFWQEQLSWLLAMRQFRRYGHVPVRLVYVTNTP